jgi:hypothetical protein
MLIVTILLIALIAALTTYGLVNNKKKTTNFISPDMTQPLDTLRNVKAGQTGAVVPISKTKLYRRLGLFRRRVTVYTGLGEEPLWHGKLPKQVDDYVRPRYVFEDCTESEEITTGHGAIVGYRISPTLVIHSMVAKNYYLSELNEFLRDFGGKLLEKEDIELLRKNFEKVSEMREMAGDTKLPNGYFWAKPLGAVIEAVHPLLPNKENELAKIANIIIKR